MQSKRRARRLHRRIATSAIAIVLWFALTGLVLNHAVDVGLHKRLLPASVANFFYGRSLPNKLDGYELGGHWLTLLDRTLYHDARAVASCDALVGAVALGALNAAACRDAVYILDGNSNLMERIDTAWGLRGDIIAIGVQTVDAQIANARSAKSMSLVIATGEKTWCTDNAITRVTPCTTGTAATTVTTIVATAAATSMQPLPAAARAKLLPALSAPAIDVERFVHDLHSGRLFGSAARFVWDLFALTLLALAATGLRMLRKR